MNIKALLRIVIIVLVFAAIGFSGAIYFSLQRYQTALENSIIANHISASVFERRLLGDDYLANPSERAKVQWFSKQTAILQVIGDLKTRLTDAEDKELVSQVETGLAGSEEIFKQIVALNEASSEASLSANFVDQENRLTTLLSLKAQETLTSSRALADLDQARAEESFQQTIFLFSIAASVFFLMLMASFWVVWRSADKVSESNKRFEFVSKATNDAIYDWDIKTNGIWFGEGMYRLFGYSKAQVTESLEWWSSKLHPEDRERIDQELDQALKSDQDSFVLEYRFTKADGNYAHVVDKALLIRDESQKPIRYVGVMQDMSKRKEYELELQKRTDEAERLNRLTVDRELKMIELKKEIMELKKNEKSA